MKVSASPKPASGPVRGLTWPILIVRLWALTGVARSTAGAAMAPIVALSALRREMRLATVRSDGLPMIFDMLISSLARR